MSNIKHWVEAARLRTLPLSVSGIILAGCFAEYNGFFKWSVFLLAILTTIALQVLSNFANDYGDGVKGTDNNQRVGPERAIQSGKLTPNQMLRAIRANILIIIALVFLMLLAAFGVRYILYTIIFFVLAAISIYASIKYTIGDNAYGYRGLGDLFVFVFFGLVSVIGCYFLFARQIDHLVFLPACAIGLLSVAVLNLNNMRDIDSDRETNKNTLVVKMGLQKAKIYHFVLVIGALFLTALFALLYYWSPFNVIFLVVFIPLIKHLKRVKNTNQAKEFDPELKIVALSTFALSVLLGVGYLL
ncbi:1,4-dihydroxy-2-naphthoate octaprenyltransferase [Hanstruepera marina]|uniref:1,4-dihydroxy-2-naphthoate octaprenyltransferase n=1 Tax=Hanstruepera marina TaxID=2873265 RepID=UPI001CA65575|nr:1,4-dihydroxy-2-naphthoate octaprenyltransferase [Hanstruepera marina]